ncbi:hypothetical protein MPL1032_240294 [Mesorhizobium plurifarium]|uniref:Uncharacterized protein n=1 Tax=Mesorhizobium plurifarium TaxID=69974 RepID=A0A0K2W0U1_MESPL|nr:hypothetical protein MPL1032_240294 [Mesorhizobium plurifarium]
MTDGVSVIQSRRFCILKKSCD